MDLRLDPQGDWTISLFRPISDGFRQRLWKLPGMKEIRAPYSRAPDIITTYDAAPPIVERLTRAGAKRGADFELSGGWVGPRAAERRAFAETLLTHTNELQPGVYRETAYQYQRDTILRACELGSAQIWVDPGGGKTLISYVFGATAPGPVIVVTRGATRGHLERECRKWTRWDPHVIESHKRSRERLAAYLADRAARGLRAVVILGWEALPSWVYVDRKPVGPLIALAGAGGGATIIFDEAHKGKAHKRAEYSVGRGGQRVAHDLCNVVSAAAHLAAASARRLLLTATPIYNVLSDLWGQCDLCHPGRMSGFWRFAEHYCGAHDGEYGRVTDAKTNFEQLPNTAELKQRLKLSSIRVPYSVSHGNLPPKRRYVERLGPEDVRKPDGGFAAALKAANKEKNRQRFIELKLDEAASMKRPWIKERTDDYLHARDGRGKVVVMTGRNREVDALIVALRNLRLLHCGTAHDPRQVGDGVRPMLWAAYGQGDSEESGQWGTSSKQRDLIARAFLAHPGPCVLVAGDGMTEGFDLQDADAMIVGKIPYEPGKVHQMEHRVCRIGQKRSVDILYPLVEGTYDEPCAAIVVGKLPAVEKVGESEELRGMTDQVRGIDDKEAIFDQIETMIEADLAAAEVED